MFNLLACLSVQIYLGIAQIAIAPGKDFDPPTIKQIFNKQTSIFTAQVPQTILASILTPPQSNKLPIWISLNVY